MKTRNTGSILLFQLVLLTLLLFQEGNPRKIINSVIGPYIAYGERFYMCEPNNRLLPCRWNIRASHFNPYKPKELQRLTGNVTSTVTVNDDCWAKVVVDVRSNNQWKENAFVFNFNDGACRVLKENIPAFYKQVLKGKDEGGCTIPPGVYEVNNTPVDWSFPKVPLLPYGSWRFRLTFGKAENLYACFVINAKNVPKTD
ncbi:uncharacterized protein LOC113210098 isoform X1 [Frankliniella occidentalis]|uniref:Uncharacterized protein LOC113210098 isoform X1 n=1 Tax=Frankliniella occidentalis TaxID=133901 RepID=A0A6J1SWI8_FRAOC|nr:uncharacterized protein LOC113210098 isoform X1 [Frankliniella occidentalis]